MADFTVYGGDTFTADSYSEGDFVLNIPRATLNKSAIHMFRPVPGGILLETFGLIFNGLDLKEGAYNIEASGDDITKAAIRFFNGWDRAYGGSDSFTSGTVITVTHSSDPIGRRFCRALITYPPLITLSPNDSITTLTGNFVDYRPLEKLTMAPGPIVTVVKEIQLPIEYADHADSMALYSDHICIDRYHNDKFIVVSKYREEVAGVSTTYRCFYFKKVAGEWGYVNNFTYTVNGQPDTLQHMFGQLCCMNDECFVAVRGQYLVVFKCTDDVWTHYATYNRLAKILQIGMKSNEPIFGEPVSEVSFLRKQDGAPDAGYPPRFVESIDLLTGLGGVTDQDGYFYNYPESGWDMQLSTIQHDEFNYGMYQQLTGGLLQNAAEACAMFRLWPDQQRGDVIYLGPAYASTFTGDKDESSWEKLYQRDPICMAMQAEVIEWEMSCQGYLMIDERYKIFVMPDHNSKDFGDPVNPTIFSYYYTYRQLFEQTDRLLSIVGTSLRYLGEVINGAVSYESPLDVLTNIRFNRLNADNEFFTNSDDGSARVFITKPIMENYTLYSPSVGVYEFDSEYEVVAISSLTATLCDVPAGTSLLFTFSHDNITFYRWGGSSWLVSTDPSEANSYTELTTVLPANPFPVANTTKVYVKIYMATTDSALTPAITGLNIGANTVSTGESIIADTSMVEITLKSDTETEFESKINALVLCEAQVSIVAPKYNEDYED